jgi:hypothetical protein
MILQDAEIRIPLLVTILLVIEEKGMLNVLTGNIDCRPGLLFEHHFFIVRS